MTWTNLMYLYLFKNEHWRSIFILDDVDEYQVTVFYLTVIFRFSLHMSFALYIIYMHYVFFKKNYAFSNFYDFFSQTFMQIAILTPWIGYGHFHKNLLITKHPVFRFTAPTSMGYFFNSNLSVHDSFQYTLQVKF